MTFYRRFIPTVRFRTLKMPFGKMTRYVCSVAFQDLASIAWVS